MSIELTYIKVGNYYIPDLTLADHDQRPPGKYGGVRN